jgi:hypothetical protein
MIETVIVNALLCAPVIVWNDDAAFHAAAASADSSNEEGWGGWRRYRGMRKGKMRM